MNNLNKHTEIEDFNNIQKNKIKAKNSLLKFEKDLFIPKKETEDNIIKDVRYLFSLKKDLEIRKHFELEKEENHYKPVTVGNFYSNNYTEYESNGGRNKTLSIKEYLNKIRPYLKDAINNLKKSDSWKIQLTLAINSVF